MLVLSLMRASSARIGSLVHVTSPHARALSMLDLTGTTHVQSLGLHRCSAQDQKDVTTLAGILEEGARGGLLLEGGGGIIIAGATVGDAFERARSASTLSQALLLALATRLPLTLPSDPLEGGREEREAAFAALKRSEEQRER
mmetsp:Transcript_42961/g.101397  ORF Transcript_42961/g.101397 Transcript_42961/m.101397 type:complete len:143 (+) Transcript_42961:28-456(+)